MTVLHEPAPSASPKSERMVEGFLRRRPVVQTLRQPKALRAQKQGS